MSIPDDTDFTRITIITHGSIKTHNNYIHRF